MSRNSFAYVSPMDLLELEQLVSHIVGKFFSCSTDHPRNLEMTVTPDETSDSVRLSCSYVHWVVSSDDYLVFDSAEDNVINESRRLIEGMDIVSWSNLLLQKVFQALVCQPRPIPRFCLQSRASHYYRNQYKKGEEIKLEVYWGL